LNKSRDIISKLKPSSSSSSSSLTTHHSFSTSNSWTLDLGNPQQQEAILQRSETFIISKVPQEDLSSSLATIHNDHKIEQHLKPQTTISTTVRPSRLPSRCPNSKIPSSNNTRSLSTQKVSKVPIRTSISLNRQQTPIKKSYIPTKIKKDTTIASNRSIPPPTSLIQSPLNKSTRPTIEIVKSNDPIEQMNSTSSESSIEEQQHMNKLLPILQDEGYSTWSSIDVKDDVITTNIKKNGTDDRQKNIGLVKTWLNTTNKQCSNKPVIEGIYLSLNVTTVFDNVVFHSM
jgi:hypothetical protein